MCVCLCPHATEHYFGPSHLCTQLQYRQLDTFVDVHLFKVDRTKLSFIQEWHWKWNWKMYRQISICCVCNVAVGLFLDVEPSSSGEWGRVSANAKCYSSSGRRQSFANSQHLYLTPVHPSVLLKTDPSTETTAFHQDEEFRLRVDQTVDESVQLLKPRSALMLYKPRNQVSSQTNNRSTADALNTKIITKLELSN